VESLPGEPVTFRLGERAFVPFETVGQLARSELPTAGWLDLFQQLGLTNVAHGPVTLLLDRSNATVKKVTTSHRGR
jgi:hypothetical protein